MQRFFAMTHKDKGICQRSSSGGAFTAITDAWFAEYGTGAVVYGCVMDEQLRVRHARAEHPQQRDAMRGSKYIGSDTSGVFRRVAEDLQEGRYVAFSGTPCQIAGLLSFLKASKREHERQLLTIELMCHGVGSVRYFQDYIASYERRFGKKVEKCSFRGKSRRGKRQEMQLLFEDGARYISPAARYDEFLSAYTRNYILRPSCLCCPFATRNRVGDITIADCWMDAGKNLDVRSMVITNCPWGEHWLEQIKTAVQWEELTAQQADQPHLNKPSDKPEGYEQFWNAYRINGYAGAQKFLGNCTLERRIKKTAAAVVYHLCIKELLMAIKCHFVRNGRNNGNKGK